MAPASQSSAPFLVLLLLAIGSRSAEAALIGTPPQDFQLVAEGARWDFPPEEATPLASARSADTYAVRMTSLPASRYELRIEILDGERLAYAWAGHVHSTFRILGSRLYYARFHPSGDGGIIVAVDLATGRELWSSPLIGLGGVQHSAYQTLLAVDANQDVVTIRGHESFGNYLELKDARTGRTVGHRIFERGFGERQPVPLRPSVRDAESGIAVACVSATVIAASDAAGAERWRVDLQRLPRAEGLDLIHVAELTVNAGRVFAAVWSSSGERIVYQLMLADGAPKLGDK